METPITNRIWHETLDWCNKRDEVPDQQHVALANHAELMEAERNATKDQAMKVYETFKGDDATYRRRIDELERAIRNLRDVSGRHNTEIACRRLYSLLPENADMEAPPRKTPNQEQG